MSVDAILRQLKELDNDSVLSFLGGMEIAPYLHNPWFLGMMGALALCCLVFKWRLLLATIFGVTGLAWLANFTKEKGTQVTESLSSNSLIFFVIGAVSIVAIMIYLVFIKEE